MPTQIITTTFTPVARPWRAMPLYGGSDPRWVITGTKGQAEFVALTTHGHDEAHATFIVKAANHYDDLRAALQAIVDEWDARDRDLLVERIDAARAVLDQLDK